LFILIDVVNCFYRHISIIPAYYLEIYLETHVDGSNLLKGWRKTADFNLALVNQVNDQNGYKKRYFFLRFFGILSFSSLFLT